MNKAAIYVRVSREDEDKMSNSSSSIKNQIEILSQFAKTNNFKIYKIYCDDGFSGADFNRPNLNLMLSDMRLKKFNTIIVKDISRIGRVMHKVGELIENVFPKSKIRVIALNDNYDSFTYKDNYSIVLKNFLNDFYLKDFKRKCKNARNYMAQTKHLNFYPKYGYYFNSNNIELIDPYSSKIVKRIFELVANSGLSTCKVANILNKEQVLTRSEYSVKVLKLKPLHKNPAKKWNAQMIWEIVSDYEYCGHSINLKNKNGGPILIKNTHLSIVDEDLFKTAQKQLKSRSTAKNRPNHLGEMIYDKFTQKNLLYEKNYKTPKYFLRLNNKRSYSICAKQLENTLISDICNVLNKNSVKKGVMAILFKRFGGGSVDKAKLSMKLETLNEEFAKLLEMYISKKICELEYQNLSTDLINKINNIESLIKQSTQTKSETLKTARTIMNSFSNIKLNHNQKLSILKMLINKVEITKTENDIELLIKYNL